MPNVMSAQRKHRPLPTLKSDALRSPIENEIVLW